MRKPLTCYAIVDEESDSSFAHPNLFNHFKIKGKLNEFSVTTLSNYSSKMSGRVAKGITIRGVGQFNVYKLPHLYEAAFIPDCRDEVATPEDVGMIKSISQFKD